MQSNKTESESEEDDVDETFLEMAAHDDHSVTKSVEVKMSELATARSADVLDDDQSSITDEEYAEAKKTFHVADRSSQVGKAKVSRLS